MKKIGGKIAVVLAVIALLGVYYYVALPAVNIHATEFWIFLVILVGSADLCQEEKVKQIRDEGIERIKSDSYGSCSDRSGISVGISSFLSDSERKEISKAYESGDRRVYKGYRGTFF